MSIQNHSYKVTRTAHYSTIGELTKKTKCIWFVMHGYGQLASRMIGKFDMLDPEENFVIAPEGLSRFYWHENNEPVACWMTKRDRYEEIKDFTNYLQDLHALHCDHVNHNVKIVLFGFSQGCATMWRWIHSKKPRYDVAINWAGWVPEDIKFNHLSEYLHSKEHHLIFGNEDKFMTEERFQTLLEVIDKSDLKMIISRFEGGHRIPKEELKSLLNRIQV